MIKHLIVSCVVKISQFFIDDITVAVLLMETFDHSATHTNRLRANECAYLFIHSYIYYVNRKVAVALFVVSAVTENVRFLVSVIFILFVCVQNVITIQSWWVSSPSSTCP